MTVKVSELLSEDKPKLKVSDLLSGAVDFMTGYTRSLVGQGMGMGFGDEIEAGVRSIIPGQEGYVENLERIRGEQKEFQQEHPYLSGGLELAGAMAPAVATRGRSLNVTLPQMAARSGATGAGYGAAYGFGTGEGTENRLSGAGVGGLVGGTAGVLANPLMAATQWAARKAVGPAVNTVRGYFAPAAQAEKEVAKTIHADRALGQGLTDQQTAYARNITNQPVTNLEQGGMGARRLARGAAATSPEAEAAISGKLSERFSMSGDRIANRWQTVSGRTGDAAKREAAEASYRASARPNYLKAYRAGNFNVESPEIRRLLQAKEVQQALAYAKQRGNSVAVADKMPWRPSDRTTLQEWDYAQRYLRSAADRARTAGDKETARVLDNLRRDLNTELDRLVPEFNVARSGAAKFFGRDNMWEAGEDFINASLPNIRSAQKALDKASPAEREMFEEGFTAALLHKVGRVRDRIGSSASVVGQIWGNKVSRQQIEMVLGPQKSREFEAFMLIEEAMDASKAAVQKYPGAGRQIAEMIGIGAASGGTSYYFTRDPWSSIAIALGAAGGRAGLRHVAGRAQEGTATEIAKLLMSDDPTVVRRAIQRVSRSDKFMKSLRAFLSNVTAVGAAQQSVGAE